MLASIPWSLLWPIILIQLFFQIISIVDLLRSQSVRWGNKAIWAIIILLMGILGPVLYWTLGRGTK